MAGLFLFLVVWVAVILAGVGVMFYLTRREGTVKSPKTGKYRTSAGEEKQDAGKTAHVRELIPLQEVRDGMYRAYGKCYMVCRLEGTNFSVMSDSETDARESALIDIMTRIDFPVQFVSNTAVTDISPVIEQVRQRIADLPDDSKLRQYADLYARQLELMKLNREVLTQKAWFIISCRDDEEEVHRMKERLNYLVTAFRERAGVVLTPVTDFGEIIDTVHEIILPEEVSRPSQLLLNGATEPVHFSNREIKEMLRGVVARG